MIETAVPIVTDDKLLHPEKADVLILRTLLPIDALVKLEQAVKALLPRYVTLSGIFIEVKLEQT